MSEEILELLKIIVPSAATVLVALGGQVITSVKDYRVNKSRNTLDAANAAARNQLEKDLKNVEARLADEKNLSDRRLKEMENEHQLEMEGKKQGYGQRADLISYQQTCLAAFLDTHSKLYQYVDYPSKQFEVAALRGNFVAACNKLLSAVPATSAVYAMLVPLTGKVADDKYFVNGMLPSDFMQVISQNVLSITSEMIQVMYPEVNH